MPANIEVPATTHERLQNHKEAGGEALRHPESAEWFNKEHNEKLKKELLWAAPYDARFPQVSSFLIHVSLTLDSVVIATFIILSLSVLLLSNMPANSHRLNYRYSGAQAASVLRVLR